LVRSLTALVAVRDLGEREEDSHVAEAGPVEAEAEAAEEPALIASSTTPVAASTGR
jgi:hypothetical protein